MSPFLPLAGHLCVRTQKTRLESMEIRSSLTFVRPDAKDTLRIDGNPKFLYMFMFLRLQERLIL